MSSVLTFRLRGQVCTVGFLWDEWLRLCFLPETEIEAWYLRIGPFMLSGLHL